MYLGRICNNVHTNLDTAVSEIETKIEISKICINMWSYGVYGLPTYFHIHLYMYIAWYTNTCTKVHL